MKTTFEHIREHLISQLPPLEPLPKIANLEYVRKYQSIVLEFERLRSNRLVFGYYRYGHNFQISERGNYNNIDSCIQRLRKYLIDGNQEHLVDVANLCMVEFTTPACHDNPHFTATDNTLHVEKL
jgi:hypothetical protein